MSRYFSIFGSVLLALMAQGATLQQLTIEDMAESATAVVRARVTGSAASLTGSTIYTHYRLEVSETWKGKTAAEVMVPGGIANGMRQSFPGVPDLAVGAEYVLFLWTSPSGIVHLVGLTQGIFNVAAASDGAAMASRPQSGELMLDAKGQKVADLAIRMRVADMKSRVATRVSGGGAR